MYFPIRRSLPAWLEPDNTFWTVSTFEQDDTGNTRYSTSTRLIEQNAVVFHSFPLCYEVEHGYITDVEYQTIWSASPTPVERLHPLYSQKPPILRVRKSALPQRFSPPWSNLAISKACEQRACSQWRGVRARARRSGQGGCDASWWRGTWAWSCYPFGYGLLWTFSQYTKSERLTEPYASKSTHFIPRGDIHIRRKQKCLWAPEQRRAPAPSSNSRTHRRERNSENPDLE